MSDDNHQTGRDDCFICSRGNPAVLETHHIVPQRHGGSDSAENLVDLCPSCHEALETLYDQRFYAKLGVHGTEGLLEQETERIRAVLEEHRDEIDDVIRRMGVEYLSDPIMPGDDMYRGMDIDSREESANRDGDEQREFLRMLSAATEERVPRGELVEHLASETDYTVPEIEEQIDKLKKKGELYNPRQGVLVST